MRLSCFSSFIPRGSGSHWTSIIAVKEEHAPGMGGNEADRLLSGETYQGRPHSDLICTLFVLLSLLLVCWSLEFPLDNSKRENGIGGA